MRCYACQCDDERFRPSIAFLAGVAFVASFKVEAMPKHLCAAHLEMMVSGWRGALSAIDPKDRRSP